MDEKEKFPNPLSTYQLPKIDGINLLIELAMDLVWSGNHGATKFGCSLMLNYGKKHIVPG